MFIILFLVFNAVVQLEEMTACGEGEWHVDGSKSKLDGKPEAALADMTGMELVGLPKSGSTSNGNVMDAGCPQISIQVAYSAASEDLLRLRQLQAGSKFEVLAQLGRGTTVFLDCTWHPFSRKRLRWDIIIAIMLAYNGIMIPYRICFGLEEPISEQIEDPLFWLDRIIDTLFLIDCFINFGTGYFNYDGVVIMEPSKIRRRYLSTWFLVDFVSSIPVEIVARVAMTDESEFKRCSTAIPAAYSLTETFAHRQDD